MISAINVICLNKSVNANNFLVLKDAVDEKADLTSKGNHLQSKEIDYSKFLGDIDFKPTSDKF